MTAPERVELSGSAAFTSAPNRASITTRSVPFGQQWEITQLTVTTTSSLRTSCTVYRNSESAPNIIDTTLRSGNGSTTDTVIRLVAGDRLVIVWSDGDGSTAIARFTATGTIL